MSPCPWIRVGHSAVALQRVVYLCPCRAGHDGLGLFLARAGLPLKLGDGRQLVVRPHMRAFRPLHTLLCHWITSLTLPWPVRFRSQILQIRCAQVVFQVVARQIGVQLGIRLRNRALPLGGRLVFRRIGPVLHPHHLTDSMPQAPSDYALSLRRFIGAPARGRCRSSCRGITFPRRGMDDGSPCTGRIAHPGKPPGAARQGAQLLLPVLGDIHSAARLRPRAPSRLNAYIRCRTAR